MSASTVRRTLIRSTPELWAEISDAAALGRHLEEFGDIRITRLEEEAAVAWESETAKGTVTLEPSGLGTRVTLTATPLTAPLPAAPRPAEAPPAAAPEPPLLAPAAPPAPAPPPPVVARPRLFPRRGAERPGLLGRLRTRPRAETPLPAAPAPPPAAQPAPVLAPQPTPVPVPPAIDTDHATAVLTNVLNQLGAARHRPFGAT